MTSFRKKIANFFYGIGGAFESAIVTLSGKFKHDKSLRRKDRTSRLYANRARPQGPLP